MKWWGQYFELELANDKCIPFFLFQYFFSCRSSLWWNHLVTVFLIYTLISHSFFLLFVFSLSRSSILLSFNLFCVIILKRIERIHDLCCDRHVKNLIIWIHMSEWERENPKKQNENIGIRSNTRTINGILSIRLACEEFYSVCIRTRWDYFISSHHSSWFVHMNCENCA